MSIADAIPLDGEDQYAPALRLVHGGAKVHVAALERLDATTLMIGDLP